MLRDGVWLQQRRVGPRCGHRPEGGGVDSGGQDAAGDDGAPDAAADGSEDAVADAPVDAPFCDAGICVVTLAMGQTNPGNIAVDSTNVYWTNGVNASGALMAVPIAGGSAVTLVPGQNGPSGIAVDSTSVYWTDLFGGTVMRAFPK